MRKCNTPVRPPTPILMKFGSGVGFGPKTTPATLFPPIDPINPLVRASERSNFGIFEKHVFGHRFMLGWSRERPKVPIALKYTQERPQKSQEAT